jgi:hypothetical protein
LAASNGDDEKSQGCSSISRQTRRRSCAAFGAVMPERRTLRCSLLAGAARTCASGCSPCKIRSRHKRCYLQSRLMCRGPLCGTSGARVSAVSSLNRSPARFIEDNIVLCPSRRRRCHIHC